VDGADWVDRYWKLLFTFILKRSVCPSLPLLYSFRNMYLFPPIYPKAHHPAPLTCKYGVRILIVVHRDLKPENVLYKTESHHSPIVIADFGIAKHLEYDLPETTTISPSATISNSPSHTDVGGEGEGGEKGEEEPREGGVDSFAGSFGYTAPEVLLGLRHGLKVDCWSIGYVPCPLFIVQTILPAFLLVHSQSFDSMKGSDTVDMS
jgi:serine/threonine protein kinase